TFGDGGTHSCKILHNCGIVFELTPNQNGTWTEHILYTFQGGRDGGEPTGPLVLDAAGNLYGTTLYFGDPQDPCGTVFELSPNGGSWTASLLNTFDYNRDGACSPEAGV